MMKQIAVNETWVTSTELAVRLENVRQLRGELRRYDQQAKTLRKRLKQEQAIAVPLLELAGGEVESRSGVVATLKTRQLKSVSWAGLLRHCRSKVNASLREQFDLKREELTRVTLRKEIKFIA